MLVFLVTLDAVENRELQVNLAKEDWKVPRDNRVAQELQVDQESLGLLENGVDQEEQEVLVDLVPQAQGVPLEIEAILVQKEGKELRVTVEGMEFLDGMEEKENRDLKENLETRAEQDPGETQVPQENQEGQVLKEFRVLMERMADLDYQEHLAHKVLQGQWVSMVLREQWVTLEEMETVEKEEAQVLRVSEVPGERLVNQVHQDWRVDKVTGETWALKEMWEQLDHQASRVFLAHLVK